MKTQANARAPTRSISGFWGHIAAIEDGAILRFAFFAMLIGTLSVLYIDFRELSAEDTDVLSPVLQPILPPARSGTGDEGRPRPDITTPPEQLEAPLTINLGAGGELQLTGTIEPGSASRFAEEIEARGEYVQTVVLDSPGGSVMDALEIGAVIHDNGLATKVAAGHLCASSCPIIFASGKDRIASRDAAIGVHQIYATAMAGEAGPGSAQAMSDAQTITARITRALVAAGVDPALWLHALDTPPDRLYYFTEEEMERLNLVTAFDEN